MTDVSIIILSYNTKDLLRSCLQSIDIHTKDLSHEVIVVDNASVDDSVAMVEKEFKNVKVIENKENYGFTKGNNIGAEHAKGKYLFFLNSDALLKDNSLQAAINFLEQTSSCAILGGQLVHNTTQQKSFGSFYTLPHVVAWMLGMERLQKTYSVEPKKVDWVTGGCMIIRKEIFKQLRGFDEKIFMYMEDMELCYRVKKLGYTVYYFPKLQVEHIGQGSSNRSFAIVHIYKGLVHFYKKHRNPLEYIVLRFILYTKALASFIIGIGTNNAYLKKTYLQALKV